MTVTIPTSEAQYGYVVGRVIRALGDTTDVDDKPDAVAATGKVTFAPKNSLGRTSDYSAFIVREKLDAPLDTQGNLVRHEGATPAGIALTVGAYRVEFTLNSGSIPGFDIEVTAGHTQAAPLDLVTAAPYVPPTGVTANTLLVPAGAVVGQVLGWSASGLDWVDMAGGGGAVSSVAGRTGAVVLSSADLTDAASLATDTELANGLAGKANASHTHAPADITGTAVITTDPRLSDARTPTTHTHPASGISDSTATGRSVLTAADAAAARTAIGAGTSNLAIGTTGTTAAAGNRQATDTAIGMVELATTAEATTGTDTTRAVTPAGLKAVADTKAASSHAHTPANITNFTEVTQDVVGAMIVGAGGTYDDAAGTITLPSGGGSDPWTYAIAATDTTNSTATAVNAAGLSLSNLPDGLYEVEWRLILTAPSAANTVRATVGWSGSGFTIVCDGSIPNGGELRSFVNPNHGIGHFPTNSSWMSAGGLGLARFSGLVRATSMAGDIVVLLVAEVAGADVAVKADSYVRYRRIGS